MSSILVMHSWMRFLILLSTLGFFGVCLQGVLSRRPADKRDRLLGGVFVGVIDLQVLLGIGLLATGHSIKGMESHVGTMVIVLVLAHVASVMNRRRTAVRNWVPVGLVGAVFVFLVTGILLTHRGLFGGVAL